MISEVNRESTMAKIQKSLMLNSDIGRLIDENSKSTGASFTRVVTAALLQYFFTTPRGVDPIWMELAVAIERNEMTLGEIPAERLSCVMADALWYAQTFPLDDDKSDEKRTIHEEKISTREVLLWKKIIKETDESDPLASILKAWAEHRSVNRT